MQACPIEHGKSRQLRKHDLNEDLEVKHLRQSRLSRSPTSSSSFVFPVKLPQRAPVGRLLPRPDPTRPRRDGPITTPTGDPACLVGVGGARSLQAPTARWLRAVAPSLCGIVLNRLAEVGFEQGRREGGKIFFSLHRIFPVFPPPCEIFRSDRDRVPDGYGSGGAEIAQGFGRLRENDHATTFSSDVDWRRARFERVGDGVRNAGRRERLQQSRRAGSLRSGQTAFGPR